MILCPVCGFRNMDANDRCFKCQAMLRRNEATFEETRKTVARRSLGDRIQRFLLSPWDWLIHRPWFRHLLEIPENMPFRFPFTAGFLSLMPGLGHWYAGLHAFGVIVFILAAMLGGIALFTINQPWSNWLLISLLIGWLLVAAHAVGTAERANGVTWRGRNTLALMFAWMMLLGIFATLIQFFAVDLFVVWLPVMICAAWMAWRGFKLGKVRQGWSAPLMAGCGTIVFLLGAFFAPILLSKNLVKLQKISTNVMRPGLNNGDRLLLSGVSIMFSRPGVGDVVYFDPDRFVATQKKDEYSVNISDYMQRVAAGPGDHLIKRGKEFLRNGVAVPPDQIPFRGDELPDFEITVPYGFCFVPVTGIPVDALASLMGAGDLRYVGQPGFSFPDFPKTGLVKIDEIRARGIAIVDPPKRRSWL